MDINKEIKNLKDYALSNGFINVEFIFDNTENFKIILSNNIDKTFYGTWDSCLSDFQICINQLYKYINANR